MNTLQSIRYRAQHRLGVRTDAFAKDTLARHGAPVAFRCRAGVAVCFGATLCLLLYTALQLVQERCHWTLPLAGGLAQIPFFARVMMGACGGALSTIVFYCVGLHSEQRSTGWLTSLVVLAIVSLTLVTIFFP